MLRHVPLALVFAACADAPTAFSDELAEAARPSLGVTLVPSGYSVPHPLGFLPGGNWSMAYGINDLGNIVGKADAGQYISHAFLYLDGSIPLQDLGTLPTGSSSEATDINDARHVVGKANIWDCETQTYCQRVWRAFRYSPGLGMQDLHSPNIGYESTAEGINSAGTIVGVVKNAKFDGIIWPHMVFRWTPTGGMQLLGTEGTPESRGFDVNDAGTIVGKWSFEAAGWSGGKLATLGHPGSSSNLASRALAINNNGWIVGDGFTGVQGEAHAFLWTWYWGMQVLGPLSSRDAARDISDKGRIVITDYASSKLKAYTFYNGQFSLLPPLTPGGHTEAYAVNTCGTIAGSAEDAAGRWVAVRWVRRTCDP
jgi:probable HAF family extracellular repeat protein